MDRDKRLDEGVKLYRELVGRDPRTSSLGILTEDMSMGAYAMHGIMWFNSKDECADYLKKYWDPVFGDLDEPDDVAETEQDAQGDGEDEDDETDAQRFRMDVESVRTIGVSNEILKILSQGNAEFLWSGTFREMCAAKDNVPRQIVARFRGEEGEVPEPVGADEEEDFIAFLLEIQEY